MCKFDVGEEKHIFDTELSSFIERDVPIFIQPKPKAPCGSILKANGHTQIFDDERNMLDDLVNQSFGAIEASNFVLDVFILNLENHREVKFIVQDCIYINGWVINNECYEKRYNKVQEIIPEKIQADLYQILPLPSQTLKGNTNPAEFQAALDWASGSRESDMVNSHGAIVRPSLKDENVIFYYGVEYE